MPVAASTQEFAKIAGTMILAPTMSAAKSKPDDRLKKKNPTSVNGFSQEQEPAEVELPQKIVSSQQQMPCLEKSLRRNLRSTMRKPLQRPYSRKSLEPTKK